MFEVLRTAAEAEEFFTEEMEQIVGNNLGSCSWGEFDGILRQPELEPQPHVPYL